MSFRRSDWPLTAEQLRTVIASGETTLVEFKRDLQIVSREGRAQLARQVMALANTVTEDELGLIVYGVDDERRGSALTTIEVPPAPEVIPQVLADYVHPSANVQFRTYTIDGFTLGVVAVLHARTRPHYCIREFPGVLFTREVYVRRDKQVGILSLPELEAMIRQKDSLLGAPTSLDPVEFGFVSFSLSSPASLNVRVRNLTTEPLTDVWVIFDVTSFRDPSLCYRSRILNNATLSAGEAREAALALSSATFYKVYWTGHPPSRQLEHIREQHFVGDRWLNVVAVLMYRGADGLFHSRKIEMPWDG